MSVKLPTEHHLEFLSLKGDCRGSSESKHVKMPHCWKSNALAQSDIITSAMTADAVINQLLLVLWFLSESGIQFYLLLSPYLCFIFFICSKR